MTDAVADNISKLSGEEVKRKVGAFCRRWKVREVSVFGSVLREDFGPDSDVDVIVRFEDKAHPTLLTLAAMQGELEAMFGRRVDLLERVGVEQMTNPYLRRAVLESLEVVYAR